MTDFDLPAGRQGKLKDKVIHDFPETPGVYTMRGATKKVLYIGKAGNLRRRVSSYFLRAHDARIERLMQEVREISYEETDTALEALILESKLIKEKHPVYNIREQDDKSFLYVAITREAFPRVLLVRGKDFNAGRISLLKEAKPSKAFGPFTSGTSIREALRILRRIFPWNTHRLEGGKVERLEAEKRPCFDYEVGLCPGTCIGEIDKKEYRKNIHRLIDVFEGKKKRVLLGLEREMKKASKALEFENAAKLRKQIFALKHIQDVALLNQDAPRFNLEDSKVKPSIRIEGYDISNISGTSAVGAMVVFLNGEPAKSEYRKFKICTVAQSDDIGMLEEVLRRRFRRHGAEDVKVQPFGTSRLNLWAMPNLILVDGGRGQVNAAREVLAEAELRIPLVGIAKGPERKRNDVIGRVPVGVSLATLIRVRDEAHRFAIRYHRKLRRTRAFE
ncbi:MAG: UvrB/UvrC motif-containing protein [Candidatus Liptonbacteria bacterium]|nr:UvrB/UvrC motif-containing protein [Candidatus Liptonbacteria bacterium]